MGQSRDWNPSVPTPSTALLLRRNTQRDISEPKSVAESRPSTDGLFPSVRPSLPQWWELPQAVSSLRVPDTSLINSFQPLWACPGPGCGAPRSRLPPVQQLHTAGPLASLPGPRRQQTAPLLHQPASRPETDARPQVLGGGRTARPCPSDSHLHRGSHLKDDASHHACLPEAFPSRSSFCISSFCRRQAR